MATQILPVSKNTGSGLITGLKRGPSFKLAGIQWGLGVWNACCGRGTEWGFTYHLIASEILDVHEEKQFPSLQINYVLF